jgi:uncharacterized protein (TIGR01777 family)
VKRVLVTGASGLLGRHVCDALLVRGDEVVGLTRDVRKAKGPNPRVQWHAWDAENEPAPAAAFEGVDAVINLIGETINQRLTRRAKKRIRASRVDATNNLLAAIDGLGERPKAFIGQSAVGYYGDRGESIVDESAPAGQDDLAQLCADWEAAESAAEALGMRTVILRSGQVLTPDGGLLKQLLLPFKLGLGGPIAGGDQYLPWIHIADEVGLFLWALDESRADGAINASSPNPVKNREFAKELGSRLHRPAVVPVPKLALAAIRGRELADAIAGGQRVVPRRAQDLGFSFRFPELGPALKDLL